MTTAIPIQDKDEAFLKATGIQDYPGYYGAFTRRNAPGAIPAGTRVTKAVDEAGDTHHIGDEGVVLGSIALPDEGVFATPWGQSKIFFWVEWDDAPMTAVGIVDVKIREVE